MEEVPPMEFSMGEAQFRRNFRIKFRDDLKKAGMSQKELAMRLGTGTSTIGRWAQGASIPDLYNYWRISQILQDAARRKHDDE